jgi:ATP-dependent helicase/nuclease subunit A
MSSPTPGAVPSDVSVRLSVLDPRQSWMLQAPAGSGKTELLMQRFLACLAKVEQPEAVLAITFTRKAAAEMRSRILLALQRAERLSDVEILLCPEHEQHSLRLARSVLHTSAALGWNILTHPARLQVRTLDSFCESVAQRAPLKGLLGGVAQVTEDARPLYELAAQRVIDQLAAPGTRGDSVAALLMHMDNDVRGLRNLLAAMLGRRDQWLHFLGRSDAFDASQHKQLRGRLEEAFVLAVNEELESVNQCIHRVLRAVDKSEILTYMRYSTSQLADGAGPAESTVDSIAASADVVSISSNGVNKWPAGSTTYLPNWRAICEFLLTGNSKKPALRKTVNVRNGFPSDTPEQKARRKSCLQMFAGLAQLPDAGELCEALNRIRRLPDPHYTELQWQFMRQSECRLFGASGH